MLMNILLRHSRLLKVVPFEGSEYGFLFAFHSDHCLILYHFPDIGRKSRFFHTLPAFDAPVEESHQNIAIMFGTEKLERCGYAMVKKV